MIESFCLICARRYSRLLIAGEKSDDGAGEGQREGEGETERVDVSDGDTGISSIAAITETKRA
jgi:hypothetical protein